MRVSERVNVIKIFYKCRNSDQIFFKTHQKYMFFSENIHNLWNKKEQKPFLFAKIYIHRSRFYLLVWLLPAFLICYIYFNKLTRNKRLYSILATAAEKQLLNWSKSVSLQWNEQAPSVWNSWETTPFGLFSGNTLIEFILTVNTMALSWATGTETRLT